jgi:hypothetical protein
MPNAEAAQMRRHCRWLRLRRWLVNVTRSGVACTTEVRTSPNSPAPHSAHATPGPLQTVYTDLALVIRLQTGNRWLCWKGQSSAFEMDQVRTACPYDVESAAVTLHNH